MMAPVSVRFRITFVACRSAGLAPHLIDHHRVRHAVCRDGAFEEAPCSGHVTALGQHEIKGLIVTINSALEISPPTSHPNVIFVHAPGSGH